MTTRESVRSRVRQMRHIDLLAYLLGTYPDAPCRQLGRMSRDGLLSWEMERGCRRRTP